MSLLIRGKVAAVVVMTYDILITIPQYVTKYQFMLLPDSNLVTQRGIMMDGFSSTRFS